MVCSEAGHRLVTHGHGKIAQPAERCRQAPLLEVTVITVFGAVQGGVPEIRRERPRQGSGHGIVLRGPAAT